MEARHTRALINLSRQIAHALAPFSLTTPQYFVLGFLRDEGPSASGVLARNLAVGNPTIAVVTTALVERRLIVRKQDPADRRRWIHEITRQGRLLLDRADSAISHRFDAVRRFGDGTASIADLCIALETWDSAIEDFWSHELEEQRIASA